MIIAVSGWRNWPSKEALTIVIGHLIDDTPDRFTGFVPPVPLFRFGDCETGVDAMMLELVAELHLPHERWEADWQQYGKAAGPLRNRAMLRGGWPVNHGHFERADLLLAFPEPGARPKIPGSGTWNCIGEAIALSIPTMIYPNAKQGYRYNLTGYTLDIFGVGPETYS